MGIYRTNNPTEFNAVDGIVIDESAPPPSVVGVGTNVAILVGQFERGPSTLEEPGSAGNLLEQYGALLTTGRRALANKRFARLKIVRAIASDAVKGTLTVDDGTATDILKFDAKDLGLYGNSLTVLIEASSGSGKKYTFSDGNAGSIIEDEVYDGIVVTEIDAATFAGSKLIDVTVLATSAEPADQVATALAAGSNGTIADTDYETAIAQAAGEGAGQILFLDAYNSTRSGYLKVHASLTQDKMVLVTGAETDDVATAVADAANYRDTDGRIIYAYPHVQTTIAGAASFEQPCSFYASLFSQISPHVDPAYAGNAGFLAGIEKLKLTLSRADYIQLKAAGISAFEIDRSVGPKIKSGIVTQIVNSSKVMVHRRRMADFLTDSIGIFLVNYQNGVNSKANRDEPKGAILDFVRDQEIAGVLPSDEEVQDGVAKLVDTDSLNTNSSIAAGFFKILYKQRIFSSMRYIVLQAEIGESVVVTEV